MPFFLDILTFEKLDRCVVPKRRCETNLSFVTSQKTTELNVTQVKSAGACCIYARFRYVCSLSNILRMFLSAYQIKFGWLADSRKRLVRQHSPCKMHSSWRFYQIQQSEENKFSASSENLRKMMQGDSATACIQSHSNLEARSVIFHHFCNEGHISFQ